jgi:hypothetical protein
MGKVDKNGQRWARKGIEGSGVGRWTIQVLDLIKLNVCIKNYDM